MRDALTLGRDEQGGVLSLETAALVGLIEHEQRAGGEGPLERLPLGRPPAVGCLTCTDTLVIDGRAGDVELAGNVVPIWDDRLGREDEEGLATGSREGARFVRLAGAGLTGIRGHAMPLQ